MAFQTHGTFLFHFKDLFIQDVRLENDVWTFLLKRNRKRCVLGAFSFNQTTSVIWNKDICARLTNTSSAILQESLWEAVYDLSVCQDDRDGHVGVPYQHFGTIKSTNFSSLKHPLQNTNKWLIRPGNSTTSVSSKVVIKNTVHSFTWSFRSNPTLCDNLELRLQHQRLIQFRRTFV